MAITYLPRFYEKSDFTKKIAEVNQQTRTIIASGKLTEKEVEDLTDCVSGLKYCKGTYDRNYVIRKVNEATELVGFRTRKTVTPRERKYLCQAILQDGEIETVIDSFKTDDDRATVEMMMRRHRNNPHYRYTVMDIATQEVLINTTRNSFGW